jgi:protease PrsW
VAQHADGLVRPRSFVRPREPAFWIYAATVVATGAITIGAQTLYRSVSPTGWLLSWALLLLYALPVFLVIYFLDLYEREPLSLVLAAFVWGAVAATQLSAFANSGWGLVVEQLGGPAFASRWTAALTAPFVEETLKGLGVVLVFLIARDEADGAMDGFVYGAICGLGFAIVEDVFYFLGVFGGTTDGVVRGFLVRVVSSGFYGHVLFSGLVGMGIGLFASRRRSVSLGRRLAELAGLCALAVAGHFLWNSPVLDFFPATPWTGAEWLLLPLAVLVRGAPLVLFVVVAVTLVRGGERRWLREVLGPEEGGIALSSEELVVLESPARRRGARRTMRRRAGPRAAALLRRLQREQLTLAALRSRSGESEATDVAVQRRLCRSLRDALNAIPGAAPTAPAQHAEPAAPGE